MDTTFKFFSSIATHLDTIFLCTGVLVILIGGGLFVLGLIWFAAGFCYRHGVNFIGNSSSFLWNVCEYRYYRDSFKEWYKENKVQRIHKKSNLL